MFFQEIFFLQGYLMAHQEIILYPVRKSIHDDRYYNYNQDQLKYRILLNPAKNHHREILELFFQSILQSKKRTLTQNHNSIPNSQLYNPRLVVDQINVVIIRRLALFCGLGLFGVTTLKLDVKYLDL
jgi:hypothetical protein